MNTQLGEVVESPLVAGYSLESYRRDDQRVGETLSQCVYTSYVTYIAGARRDCSNIGVFV